MKLTRKGISFFSCTYPFKYKGCEIFKAAYQFADRAF